MAYMRDRGHLTGVNERQLNANVPATPGTGTALIYMNERLREMESLLQERDRQVESLAGELKKQA
jgi:hypothetical protein